MSIYVKTKRCQQVCIYVTQSGKNYLSDSAQIKHTYISYRMPFLQAKTVLFHIYTTGLMVQKIETNEIG